MDNSKILFIQDSSSKIASTQNSNYSLIDTAFGHHSSNLDKDEIKDILKAFKVDTPWQQMSVVSSNIGLTALPLDNSFINAANRRHSAAHDINANTPVTDLFGFIQEAFGIAIAFDSVLSKSLFYFKTHNQDFVYGNKTITSNNIKISSLKFDSNKWKYKRYDNLRAVRAHSDKNIVENEARTSALLNYETLIIYNINNEITEWVCNY